MPKLFPLVLLGLISSLLYADPVNNPNLAPNPPVRPVQMHGHIQSRMNNNNNDDRNDDDNLVDRASNNNSQPSNGSSSCPSGGCPLKNNGNGNGYHNGGCPCCSHENAAPFQSETRYRGISDPLPD